MKKMSNHPHTGSSFDDFLREEGIYEECTATALKRVLAWQVEQEMRDKDARSSKPESLGCSTWLRQLSNNEVWEASTTDEGQ